MATLSWSVLQAWVILTVAEVMSAALQHMIAHTHADSPVDARGPSRKHIRAHRVLPGLIRS